MGQNHLQVCPRPPLRTPLRRHRPRLYLLGRTHQRHLQRSLSHRPRLRPPRHRRHPQIRAGGSSGIQARRTLRSCQPSEYMDYPATTSRSARRYNHRQNRTPHPRSPQQVHHRSPHSRPIHHHRLSHRNRRHVRNLTHPLHTSGYGVRNRSRLSKGTRNHHRPSTHRA